MNTNQNYEDKLKDAYITARKKTDELKEFYMSLILYCLVIPFLFYIWYTFTPFTIQWFWFPAFFWGLSLVIRALKIFGKNVPFGSSWEQRQIDKYMDEEQKNTNRF